MTVPTRSGVFWGIYVSVLAGAALFIAHSFVGVFVLGLFGYYAIRPISNRFEAHIESKRVSAGLTALTVLVPVLVLTIYAGIRVFQQIQQRVEGDVLSTLVSRIFGIDMEMDAPASLLRDPPSITKMTDMLSDSGVQQGLAVLDMVFGTVLFLVRRQALVVHSLRRSSAYDASSNESITCLLDSREVRSLTVEEDHITTIDIFPFVLEFLLEGDGSCRSSGQPVFGWCSEPVCC
jgi:hypothetical protein